MKGRLVWSEKHFCFAFQADELGFTNLDSLPELPDVTAIEFRGVTYLPQKPQFVGTQCGITNDGYLVHSECEGCREFLRRMSCL